MTHLRFLDLSKNDINQLPAKLSMLRNLQTLIIDSNVKVLQFPAGMEKVPNLRHLDLGSRQPFVRPPGIEQLTNLQTLRTIAVVGYYRDEVWRTGVLRELVNLQELRVTIKLGNLDAKEKETNNQGILMNMKNLRKLELFWHPMKIENADNLLASFKPPTNVKHLVLDSCGGIQFPDWLGNPSQILRLSCLANERFPSLKTLELVSLSHLESWTDLHDGDMPLLQELHIVGCQMLSSLPTLKFLGSLQKLHIEYCQKLQAFPDEKPPITLNYLAFKLPLIARIMQG
ncbi:putative disease resistance RPP13-like protein 1 [Papaver somniferum]|uniref:putative disease resistance RPP13-like protein 1 n=1 Tax=Papaver somniferum TaxID=3469 RepID=UPI000E6F4E2D|nr:putative disease resistance RPP13-like protein 1 [Papaver somniferum]